MSFNLLQIEQSKVLIPITNAKQKQSRTKAHNQCTDIFFQNRSWAQDKLWETKSTIFVSLPRPPRAWVRGYIFVYWTTVSQAIKEKIQRSSTDFCWSKYLLKLLSLQLDSERGQMNQLFIPLPTHQPYMPTNRTLTAADSYNMAGPHVDQASS